MIELTDINTMMTLYTSLLLGISFNFLLRWSLSDSFIESFSDQSTSLIQPPQCYEQKNLTTVNLILLRIIKFIRKKIKVSQDDPESAISSKVVFI
ncbi:hypothetical protein [Bacillus sp. cl95]|uniref:hypothetical protein n=2 Tax=unclassified Bacillus (in: firmicutes) TaxID=185979 RepID=UPI0011142363|nr:hypothetical protein [Bacillus sp. cl95]